MALTSINPKQDVKAITIYTELKAINAPMENHYSDLYVKIRKFFKRSFPFPILIHKTNTYYDDSPDISIRLRKSKMSGSMKFTSYTLQIVTKTKNFQWTFVWRPNVTIYWWKKHDTR